MSLFSWLKSSPLDPLRIPSRARIRDEWLDHELEVKAAAVRAKYGLGDPLPLLRSQLSEAVANGDVEEGKRLTRECVARKRAERTENNGNNTD